MRIRLERIVPLQAEIIPLFWVHNGDETAIKTTLEEHPSTTLVPSLTTAEDEQLFEVRWQADIDGLIQAMIETDARLLEADGCATEWEFRLRFASHDAFTAFNQAVTDAGIHRTFRRLYTPTFPEEEKTDDASLSDKQREAIEQAYHHGYFSVPRNTTVDELAATFGISDSAYSQRLRRDLATLVGQTLIADDTTGPRSELAE